LAEIGESKKKRREKQIRRACWMLVFMARALAAAFICLIDAKDVASGSSNQNIAF
jgi:hypothetical protein